MQILSWNWCDNVLCFSLLVICTVALNIYDGKMFGLVSYVNYPVYLILMQDILLVLVAPALEPLFLPNQFQQLMAETSPFHCQKLKDVQIAQERERLDI